MSWLLWKDYRLNRPLFVFIGAMVIGPYVIGFMIYLVDAWSPPVETSLFNIVSGANVLGIGSIVLYVALLAGNAIASERVDHSSDFLASLPISRARILSSKIIVILGTIAGIAAVQLTVCYVFMPAMSSWQMPPDEVRVLVVSVAFTGLLALGAGWAGSAVLDSPTFSIALSIFVLASLGFTLAMLAEFSVATGDTLYWAWLTACLVIGLPSFIGGWWCYLRRVVP